MSGKRWVYDQNFYEGEGVVDGEGVAVRDAWSWVMGVIKPIQARLFYRLKVQWGL